MKNKCLGLVLSARKGNCWDFARHVLPESDILVLGELHLESCSKCDYECMKDMVCPKNDDIGKIYEKWMESDTVVLFSPVYDGRPPSLYYIFEERTPSLWKRKCSGFASFGNRNAAIVIVGNENVERAEEILSRSLENLGLKIITSIGIHPNDYPVGGGIKGGLIANREIVTKLDAFKNSILQSR